MNADQAAAAFLGAAALLGAAAPALAGPLTPAWVAEEAELVVHVDLERFRESTLGRFVLENAEALHIELDELEELRERYGFDPCTDVLSVTGYEASRDGGEVEVVVAVTTSAADAALEKLAADPDSGVRRVDLEGLPAFVITEGGGEHYLHVRSADRPERRVAVLAQGRETLLEAVKVLEGRAPGLAAGKGLLARPPRPGSILFAAASDPDEIAGPRAASEILRRADAIVVDLGEAAGAFEVEVAVSAPDEQVAGQIAQIVKGMVALGQIMAGTDPEMTPVGSLLGGLGVDAQGSRITVRFAHAAEELVEIIESICKEDQEPAPDRPAPPPGPHHR